MKKCYNIKTLEDITDRTTIGAKEDCIFIVHQAGSVYDFVTDSGDCVEKKLSTFEMLERMIDHDDACRNSVIKQSTPTDPVLARLCELTSAKMYEDYVAFEDYENYYEAFEEYSKHLRNEENKFEEIKKLLNL
jgi:hypothetical protein